MAHRWWERDPDRLKWELERFIELGLDPHHEPIGDSMVIKVRVRASGRWEEVEVVLPAFYPDAMPQTFLHGRSLNRHHSPDGLVCVFPDPEGGDWSPSWSAAEELIPRLRGLLADLEVGGHAIDSSEVPWAEPITAFYSYNQPALVLPEPLWDEDLPARRGNAWLQAFGFGSGLCRKATARVGSGVTLVDENDPALLRIGKAVDLDDLDCVAWYALDEPLRPPALGVNIADTVPLRDLETLFQRTRSDPRRALFTFMEEGPARGQRRRAWVLVQIQREDRGTYRAVGLHECQELSRSSRRVRLPGMEGLAQQHVAIVGAGSLGSPVALELAKAGVGRLTIIDDDLYDVGNAVRHALPVTAAGTPKAPVVAALASDYNPYLRVEALVSRLGYQRSPSDDVVKSLIESDLVIDTTGSTDAARAATTVRQDVGSLLISGLSYGIYGGELLIHRPDGPCFDCFKLHQDDEAIPKPPHAVRMSPLTPVGCRTPAFPGPGFSVTHFAAVVTRAAVQELGNGYLPVTADNWSVLDLHSDERRSGVADVHAECHRHG